MAAQSAAGGSGDSGGGCSAPLKGAGSAQLSQHGVFPAVFLPADVQRRIASFVAASHCSPHSSSASPASQAVATALSSLCTATLLQNQADSLQQTLAVCAAYGLVDKQPTALSSNSRKQLRTLLPPGSGGAESREVLADADKRRLQSDVLHVLLPLMLAGVRYPRNILSPLLSLLDGLCASAAAVDAETAPFIAQLLSSTAGAVGMAEVSVIEVALEWPPLTACLARHTGAVMAAFSAMLAQVAARGREGQDGAADSAASAESGESDLASPVDSDSDIVLFLRVFVQFVTRCKAAVYEWTLDSAHRAQLSSIALSLSTVMQSALLGKDPITQSALLHVLLVHNPAASTADRLALYHRLFLTPTRVSSSLLPDAPEAASSSSAAAPLLHAATSLTPALCHPLWSAFVVLYTSSQLSPHWFASCTPIGRLALYRAMLTQSPPSLLVQPVSVDEADVPAQSSSASAPSSSSGPSLLLFLFPLLASDCSSPSAQVRYYALHCMSVWCATLEQSLQSAAADSPESQYLSSAPVRSVLRDCLSTLLAALSVNWEHPFRVIISASKQLFAHFVRLSALLARPAQPDFLASARPLLAACLSHYDRGSYQQLNVLTPHIGALVLLNECPQLVQHTLTAARYQPIWGVAGGMLQRLLVLAKQEMERAVDGGAASDSAVNSGHLSKRGKAKVRDAQRVQAVSLDSHDSAGGASARWRELWLEPIASALLSDDEQTRQALCTSLVAELLKVDSSGLAPLLSALQSVPDSDATADSASTAGLSFRHLRALLCVLTTARRIGLISSHQLHSCLQDTQRTAASLPVTRSTLLACLVHADAGLRLECAELVCSNLYMAELPSVSELQLLTHALPHLVQIEEPAVTEQPRASAIALL